jgi:hypothetical protein
MDPQTEILKPAPEPPSGPMKWARRIVIGVVGGTVLAIGVLMIALPGPAFLVIPAGLAILSLEFLWARRWLKKFKACLPERFRKKEGKGTPEAKPPRPPRRDETA